MKSKKRVHHQSSHQSFWVGICLLFAASAFTYVLLSTPSLTGNASVQTISLLHPGQDLQMEVQDVKGLQQATFIFRETVKNELMQIKPKNGQFEGISYSQFDVYFPSPDKVAVVQFQLKIKEQDLRSMHLKPEEVKLYLDGDPVTTVLAFRKEGYVYYDAKASSLGRFVIGKKNVAAPAMVTSSTASSAEAVPAANPQPEETVEPAAEPAEATAPLVGESIQQPLAKVSWWTGIKLFLRNIFS